MTNKQAMDLVRASDITDIANVILDIIDLEKQYVAIPEYPVGDVTELRMQLREVAFALINGKKVKPSDLS